MASNKEVEKVAANPALLEILGKALENSDSLGVFDGVGIDYEGKKIILPDDPTQMSKTQAITALRLADAAEKERIDIYETIDAFPLDGAVAMTKAMRELFGWATPIAKKSWFGAIPPTERSVEIGYQETISVVWGRFSVPKFDDEDSYIECGVTREKGRVVFQIHANVKKMQNPLIRALAEKTREIVRTDSIYRGKAFILPIGDKGEVTGVDDPTFFDLSRVNEEELVFSDQVMAEVQTNIFTPIRHTEYCKKAGVPLKCGVLLSGEYGTGKTLTAFITA
jgi:transitional endoplasmic reticulum ATPase